MRGPAAALLLLPPLAFLLGHGSAGGVHAAQVRALYVFGDSTVDVGNNNYLPGGSGAGYPYGIDFPHSRATGRYSNGYNVADFIARLLGFKRSPPAYLSLASNTTTSLISRARRGVSYASGGSGILDSTGRAITMTKQVEYFASTRSTHLQQGVPPEELDRLLSASLFFISSGGNDLFAFVSQNKSASDAPAFIASTLAVYKAHIEALYKLGARKFGVLDVGPIGCVPSARARNPTGDCVAAMNKLAAAFNAGLDALFAEISSELAGVKYSIGSTYALVTSFIAHPEAAGFSDVSDACCGGGRMSAEVGCMANSTICGDRRKYLFWDGVHGTQQAARIAAAAVYGAPPGRFSTPVNLKQLVGSM